MTPEDPRVERLLDQLLDSHLTPEQVCAESPDLLPMIRNQWRMLKRLGVDLDTLFPVQDDHPGAALPEIPGYEVESVLGRGGVGIIYRVHHVKLNRDVALKMLLSGNFADTAELARFTREAQAIAALQHPNIVQIYDVGDVDGRAYFTMELVGGGSLSQKLGGTPQSAQYCCSITETLARAIHAAHVAGIVHRDLKPANILLTPDGTPKITDFGLARQFEEQSDITLEAARVGTPSYMAPEQVAGKPGAAGPPADIYGLGATLYELLTGRPPFRADTPAETQRQVLAQDPVAPSRFNAKIPRDLETICLKCLAKEPQRRYESAASLADDLVRYREGRPILARRLGPAARTWRWCRRNPASASLATIAFALFVSAIGSGLWLEKQRTERRAQALSHDTQLRNDVGTTLAQAANLRDGFHFAEAGELLKQALERLGASGSEQLRQQLNQAQADLDLARRLDAAQFEGARIVSGRFDPIVAEPLYLSAFADAGLGTEKSDSDAVAARIRASAVRAQIIAALDDWASVTQDKKRRAWLLAVARRADPNPTRDQLRQPQLWQDATQLTQHVNELNVSALTPQLATALGRMMRRSGGNAEALLTAAQARFPQDYWLNYEIGVALRLKRPEEALGYFRAALALRPDASAAYNSVGSELNRMGRSDQALDCLRQAIRIDPNYATAQLNAGNVLCGQGRMDEAIDHLQRALRIDPNLVVAHVDLGVCLSRKNPDEAIAQFRQALVLDPQNPLAHNNLGYNLYLKGRVDEAIEHLELAVRFDPTMNMACENLGQIRFISARTAVLAAAGHASDKAGLPDADRARLRRKALEKLRTDLAFAIQLAGDGKIPTWSPSAWQSDRALKSVRDSEELAKLPAEEQEQWRQFWTDVAAMLAADPLARGRAFAAAGNWDRALDNYSRVVARGTDDNGHFLFEYAALLLLCGEPPGYTTACAHMIAVCGKANDLRPYHVARACTLAPDSVADWSLPARLANNELHASNEQFWSLTEQGALEYRAGRFQSSVPLFERSLRAEPRPGAAVLNWLWLALANQRLGKTQDARRWLEKAQTWLDQFHDGLPANAETEYGLHLHNWLEANILRREAEALIAQHQ